MKKIKKYILLSVFLLLTAIMATGSDAYATTTGGNADGSGGGSGTKHVEGGPYYARTGWLVYIVD